MRRSLPHRHRERGGALIVVLIVLVLMAALSLEVAATAVTHGRLAEHGMNDFLLRTAAEGRREILRKAILYAKSSSQNQVTEEGDWSWFNADTLGRWGENPEGLAPPEGGGTAYKNTDVELDAWCEDERAKICLLGLVPRATDDENSLHARTRRVLIRLIDVYREAWSDLDLSEADAEEMVDELVEWLHTSADDDDESPTPDVAEAFGRLQSIDDLRRIPGGFWSADRLYDVRDPEWEDEDEGQRRRARDRDDDDDGEDTEEGQEDSRFFRPNGVPGLARFLTVHAQGGETPEIRINFNTAPHTLIKALFDPEYEELAEAIIQHRRQNVGSDEDDEPSGEASEQGYFTGPSDIGKVEGFDDTWQSEYPLAASFFDVDSRIFSICVIAKVVQVEGQEADEEADEDAIPEVVATYQYREMVEFTGGGQNQGSLRTRLVERRRDPYFDRQ